MNIENPATLRQEREKNPEAVRAQSAQDVSEYYQFADPVLGVDWGEDGVLDEYAPEYVVSHPELTQVFVARDSAGEVIAGGKVTMLDLSTMMRLDLDRSAFADETGALLEYTAVQEEYRNKGILGDIMSKRIAWAKEHGATFVCSEAEINNPISVYTKIRDGFVLTSIQEPDLGVVNPYFVEVMSLDGRKVSGAEGKPEWKEVVVTSDSFDELQGLFNEGWIGVDIKGAAEAPEKLSMPWTLVMEKREAR